MKVIHALGWYFPDSMGGTEVYVSQLVAQLRKQGIDNVIAAARDGYEDETYIHEGTEVFRYPVHPSPSQQQVRGAVPYGGFDQFVSWLSKQSADVYHQHSMVGGCGIHHLQAARKLGLRTVVTVHLPGAICLRGTMMLYGSSACDGHVEIVRCGVCWAMSKGLTRPLASVAGRFPRRFSEGFQRIERRGLSVLATSSLVDSRLRQMRELSGLADRTVAIAQWIFDALIANGFDRDKLVLSHSGGPTEPANKTKAQRARAGGGPLKIGFLGRLVRVKGLDVLIRAFQKLPANLGIELLIYGISNDSEERAYENNIRQLANRDSRIRFMEPVTQENLRTTLKRFDLLAIPSQGMETGPLVLLESFAAGVPVIASNLGGIAERVRDRRDGWLVKCDDVREWSAALERLANDRALVDSLRENIQEIRTMETVASEMATIYREALSTQSR